MSDTFPIPAGLLQHIKAAFNGLCRSFACRLGYTAVSDHPLDPAGGL